MRTTFQFVKLALDHHRIAVLVSVVLTGLAAVLASTVVPDLYYVEATVYVQEPAAVHRLANPFAAVPSSRRELEDVPELLSSREKLVALAKRSGLMDQWDVGRPWLLKQKDALQERIRGPIDEADRLDALVAMLERRVSVEIDGNKAKVAAEWTSRETATVLVQTQLGALMQLRMQREGKTLEEAAKALDEQLAMVRAEMSQRVEKIERATNAPGGWAVVEVEREQLLRDQARAADLMVQAEEKHITAEVFQHSNSLRFTIIAPPSRPKAPNGPSFGARVVLGIIASLLAALVCASILGLVSGRVLSNAQLEAATGLKVLGSLRAPAGGLIVNPSRWAIVLAVGVALATGAALGLTRGNPVMTLLPPLAVIGGWLVWTRPLKWPLLAVFLLAVVLDDPTDRPYVGLWRSPLWPLGRIFHTNIALFTGFELALIALFGVMLYRRIFWTAAQRSIDPVYQQAPRPLQLALVLSFLTVGWLVVMGVGRGGVFREALWQFRYLLFMPVAGLLVMYAFEIPRDLPRVLAVLIFGSIWKALHGAFFMYAIAFPQGEYPPHTTGHNDTMIFVIAVVAACVLFFEKPTKRHFWLLVLWLPFVGVALKLNDRRIAYVDIVMALGLVYLMSPMHEMKRKLTRFGVALLPVLLLYTAAGWNSRGGSLFGPVQKVRSIIAPAEDTEEESSNVERDIENFNLMKSWERNMLFGQGFGHAFTEFIPSNDFRQSNFGHVGHNSILWLLWIGGILGFTGVTLWIAVAAFFLGRTLHRVKAWDERVALFVSLAILVTYLFQAFGDMGTQSMMFDLFCALAVATIGRLATKHGSWTVDSPVELRANAPSSNGLAAGV